MADVNWGILQPLQSMAPIQTASPQGGGGIISAPGGGSIDPNAQAKLQIDRDRLAMEQAHYKTADAATQQQMNYAAQLQPGVLQGQQLTNQGQVITNKTNQMALDAANLKAQNIAKVNNAFIEGQKTGGTEGGLDAMGRAMLETGDAAGYQSLETSRAALTKTKQEIGNAGLVNVGMAIGHLPTLKDYTDAYDTLKQTAPYLPKPSSYKNDTEYQTHLQIPAVAMAGPVAAQEKANIEASKNDKLYQAQQEVTRTINDYQNSVNRYGIDSPQAKRAKTSLQEAQTAAQVATGVGTGITGTIKSLLPDKTDYSDIEGKAKADQGEAGTDQPVFSKAQIEAEMTRREQEAQAKAQQAQPAAQASAPAAPASAPIAPQQ